MYVVELNNSILNVKRLDRINPDHREGMPCLYVGKTYHSPEERFRQHKADEKAGRGYVRDYGERLRPEFFEHRNPLTEREATIEERALAFDLREEGYAVWQN